MKDEDIEQIVKRCESLSFIIGFIHGKLHEILISPDNEVKNKVHELFNEISKYTISYR